MDDPNAIFVLAVGVVAIVVAVGKLIQWVRRS